MFCVQKIVLLMKKDFFSRSVFVFKVPFLVPTFFLST